MSVTLHHGRSSIQHCNSEVWHAGRKDRWTYIEIPADVAQQLCRGNRKGFCTKGKLDNHKFSGKSLLPIGSGNFNLTLDVSIRKAIGKRAGAMLKVQIEFDKSEYELSTDLMECLEEDAKAFSFFKTLPRSHQNYFSKWVESAKTDETKAKRIAMALNAFQKKRGFPENDAGSKKHPIVTCQLQSFRF